MGSRFRPLFSALTVVAVVGASCRTPSDSVEYSVVAAPPLPVSPTVTSFDPDSQFASLDGSTIVEINTAGVEFWTAVSAPAVSVPLPGSPELRAVSADGTRAALLETQPDRTSRITVIDRNHSEPAVSVFLLPGLIEPEAFSTDGELLFVIDHRSSVPGSYRVRPLNLATGELEPILGPSKVPLLEEMNGQARRQVWAPNGSRLYTLYIRQTHHHHDDPGINHAHGQPGTDGFVHVLDLDEEWAFCVDLPAEFGDGDLDSTALAVSPSGSSFVVADQNAGQLAFASSRDLEVTHVQPMPSVEPSAPLQMGLTSTHLALGWDKEVRWFNRDTLQPDGDALTLREPLAGFSPGGPQELLAWTSRVLNGPRVLRAPS